jgi:hypothetical protein
MWSFISMATLLCEPPARNHTPAATLSAVTFSVAALTSGGTSKAGWRIGLDLAHGQVQDRVAAQALADAHRELDPADLLVVRERDHRPGVAHHRVRQHRLDLLHQPVGC